MLFAVALAPSPRLGEGAALNWKWQSPLPEGNPLTAVAAASTTTAWAVGEAGTILATTDGGATWVVQTSGTNQMLDGVGAASTTVAWAVGWNGTILATT